MKIILLGQVTNLGKLGDVVEVANGYARNYLIPYGFAKRATKENLAEFEAKRAEYEKHQEQVLKEAILRKEKLDGRIFAVLAKAGVDGKLFGSVTSFDIVEVIKKAGVEVKKSEVKLPNGPLKTIGEFDITVILHNDVESNIKVNVVNEESSR